MKSLKYYLMALAGIAMLNACSDDDFGYFKIGFPF